MNILVIPDAHAKPGVSMRRFDWLGKVIVDLRPDVVVDLGDWADMESLSSYDKGKKSFEGRRYAKDVAASVEARERVARHLKKSRKRPRLVALGGNHDYDRIHRATELTPELDGTIGVSDQQHAEYGWDLIPYLHPHTEAGYAFQHYFGSGLMQRPIGGERHALRLLQTQFTSCIQGHSHLWDEAERTLANGRRIQAFVPGCFLDPEQWESYAGRANTMWWRGLLWLPGAEDGYCRDFQRISIEKLQREYR